MSTSESGTAGTETLPPPTGTSPVPPAAAAPDRTTAPKGTLYVAPRVVARVAEVAASRVAAVMPVSGGPLVMPADPLALGATHVPAPSVSASAVMDGDGHDGADGAVVHLTIGVEWPAAVTDVAAAVAQAVTDEVRRLAGVRVHRVDVDVAAIGTLPRRRVR